VKNADRLREKIQVTIDDRQVAALAVGALLLLAGMFALGLLVGIQMARRAPQPVPAGDLAALDEQRAEAQRRAGPQDAPPTQPARNAPSGTAAPPAAVSESGHPTEQKRHDPRPTKDVPAPPATVNIAPPPASTLREAPAAFPEPPKDLGKFTVQLGASQDPSDAAQLASRAGAVGLKAYVAEARIRGKGTWYRVRVGSFPDKASADRFRRDVERELRAPAAVMPAR
jgi:DedD protein